MFADADLWLVIGMALGILTIPALISSWSEGDPPRASAITVLIAGGMIAYAMMNAPGGSYTFSEIPDVIARVIGRYL